MATSSSSTYTVCLQQICLENKQTNDTTTTTTTTTTISYSLKEVLPGD